MLELLLTLEFKRDTLRRKLLRALGLQGTNYFGVALIVLAVSMAPIPLVPITLPIFGTVAAFLLVLGILLVITILMMPLGLFIM